MLPWKQAGVMVLGLLLLETTAVDGVVDGTTTTTTNTTTNTTTTTSNTTTNTTYYKDILMRGARPLQPDAYLCTGYEVDEDEAYIVEFEAEAFADTAHHILIYGCEYGPASSKDFWDCPAICQGGRSQIMFAWAKNAPPTHLPQGVGLRIGKKTSIKTIVMQIHYARAFKADDSPDRSGIRLHLSRDKQQYVAGVFLLMSYNFAVPPNQTKYHVDISCRYNSWFPMVPFAYRTHAHGLGRVITGYQHNVSGYHLIGKGNPQWPQAFYPSNASIVVKPGDHLLARCTYNSVGVNRTVDIGATGEDEMCNFYIMFYTQSSVEVPSGQCGGVDSPSLVDNLPQGSDVTLPPQPWMEDEAKGHHHHHHHHHYSMTTSHQPLASGETPAESADQNQPPGRPTANSSAGQGKELPPTVQKAEKEVGGWTPLVLVGPLVAVPLVIIMVVVIVWHQTRQGVCTCCNPAKTYRGASLSDRLRNSRKGFDPLLQHLSEDSDSENEMFLQPAKNGTRVQKE